MSDLSGVLVLWDIDGTLVTHAPSPRDRHAHAVACVLGRTVDPIEAGVGKTDRQIIIELFADQSPSDEDLEQAFAIIDQITYDDLIAHPSTPVAGVSDVLETLAHLGASHSVLTGNTPARARLKLESAGLAEHIDFDSGYYGHIHSTRMELVADAAQRLSLQAGVRPVIVGDTPLDIMAGQASGIPVVAVATGVFSVDDLLQHRPDAVVSSFDGTAEMTTVIHRVMNP